MYVYVYILTPISYAFQVLQGVWRWKTRPG